MSLQKPLEGLLRPPLEWYTATALSLSGLLLWIEPRIVLAKECQIYVVLLLFLAALWRFKQGYRVFRYQRRLKRMPNYTINSAQLPVSAKTLFLGKGFLWTTEHTQRLRDLDLDYNLPYKQPSRLKIWARRQEARWENDSPTFKKLSRLLSQDVCWNPFRPYPPVGGQACLHGVADQEEDIAIALSERASHLVVVGLPGMGKTRFAEILIGQDIRRGDVVIVLDPKGDADLLRRMVIESQIAGREQDLLVFHLGFPQSSCRYNPVGNFTRVTEVANRISNQLPSSGDSAAFKDFGWQFINSMAMALVSMGEKPDYQKLKFYITKMDVLLEKYLNFWLPFAALDSEQWITDTIQKNNRGKKEKKETSRLEAMIAYVQEHALIDNSIFDDLYHACKYDKEYFSKITASLGPLLKKLTTGKAAELLSPDYEAISDQRPILDWLQVIRNKQIVYVGLDALTDREVATAVGNAMFSDLVSVAGRLYKFGLQDGFYKTALPDIPLPRVCVHSDEFNEIIGDEFIPLLNKARGAGFTVTAYTQTWSDVEARLKSAAKAGQIAGNFGTIVMFRCQEVKTIQILLEKLPKVPVMRTVPVSSSTDATRSGAGVFYQSGNQDSFNLTEQSLVTANDVLNLPKGQAFCLLEGGKLYKLRMPLPQVEHKRFFWVHRRNQWLLELIGQSFVATGSQQYDTKFTKKIREPFRPFFSRLMALFKR
jgi:conjugative coupling factor TraD (TOL family)